MSETRDVVIVGSGPAGYTAAFYTARAQLKPLLFGSSIFVGGSLTTTTEVENFPGFPEGVDGPVPMENMRAQATPFGAEMIDDDIVSADLTGDVKLLTDSAGTVHRAKTVIVATGSGYRKLGLPKEDELSGRGVSWCATCDGFFFKGTSSWSAARRRQEEATFSPPSPSRSPSCTAARPCAPRRSCRTGPSSAIRRRTGVSSHVDRLTNCCSACMFPSGSRSAIGWIDLRRPSTISPRG